MVLVAGRGDPGALGGIGVGEEGGIAVGGEARWGRFDFCSHCIAARRRGTLFTCMVIRASLCVCCFLPISLDQKKDVYRIRKTELYTPLALFSSYSSWVQSRGGIETLLEVYYAASSKDS